MTKAWGVPAAIVALSVDHGLVRTGAVDVVAGEYVEIAFVPHTDGVTYVAMRNSAHPEGPVLVFTPSEWDAFVEGAKAGEFDEPW